MCLKSAKNRLLVRHVFFCVKTIKKNGLFARFLCKCLIVQHVIVSACVFVNLVLFTFDDRTNPASVQFFNLRP